MKIAILETREKNAVRQADDMKKKVKMLEEINQDYEASRREVENDLLKVREEYYLTKESLVRAELKL